MRKKIITIAFGFIVLSACSPSEGGGNLVGSISSSSEIILSSSSTVTTIDYTAGQAMNAKLGKGINLGNTFDAPTETAWGAGPVTELQIQTLANLGFNSIRLPVRWDSHAATESPYTIDADYIARVQEVLGWIQANGMRAIINMHHQDAFLSDTLAGGAPNTANVENHVTRVVAIWQQIATAFAAYDNDFLLFEIFNEPVYGVSAESHNKIIARSYPIIRASNPGRTLMYGAYPWDKYTGLKTVQLPAEGNIIFTVHYYDPSTFAQQRVNQNCLDLANSIIWEGTATEIQALNSAFDEMQTLADTYYPGGLPINIGEFGATACGGISSKAKWTAAVARAAESRNMSWHYWAFTSVGGFELYDKSTALWDTTTYQALFAVQ
ncbi:MAG: glycoside hydrolase family 5 protein [Fibrobacteraceae bacterium]